MLEVVLFFAYSAVASVVMFVTVRLDRKLGDFDRMDCGVGAAVIAILWPIAFPVFLAYAMAHIMSDREEEE